LILLSQLREEGLDGGASSNCEIFKIFVNDDKGNDENGDKKSNHQKEDKKKRKMLKPEKMSLLRELHVPLTL
jgi:hypothetical protein